MGIGGSWDEAEVDVDSREVVWPKEGSPRWLIVACNLLNSCSQTIKLNNQSRMLQHKASGAFTLADGMEVNVMKGGPMHSKSLPYF